MAKEHAGSKTFDMAKEHAGSKTTEKAISADGDLDVAGTTVVRAPQRKQNWFYCGVSLGLAHLYPKTASYTKGHIAKGTTREHKVIYYGSYAYNRDSFLVDSGIFCGYCATVLRKILLGAELRGGVSFRESEISSNGVFSEVGKDPIEQGWPETFTDHNGEAVKEADFSYSRQTLRQSRFVTLLPRIGAALSESTSVYALLGIKYGWWQITDHPEEIEVITTYNAKEHKDVIYSGGCVSYIGGICLETSLFERGLLRFECLYSPGPKLEIERQTLQEEYDTADVNRQLESLKINSIKHISFGVSVGVKF
jgi:hypothetical protein